MLIHRSFCIPALKAQQCCLRLSLNFKIWNISFKIVLLANLNCHRFRTKLYIFYPCTVNTNLIRAFQKITRILEHPVEWNDKQLKKWFSQKVMIESGYENPRGYFGKATCPKPFMRRYSPITNRPERSLRPRGLLKPQKNRLKMHKPKYKLFRSGRRKNASYKKYLITWSRQVRSVPGSRPHCYRDKL